MSEKTVRYMELRSMIFFKEFNHITNRFHYAIRIKGFREDLTPYSFDIGYVAMEDVDKSPDLGIRFEIPHDHLFMAVKD